MSILLKSVAGIGAIYAVAQTAGSVFGIMYFDTINDSSLKTNEQAITANEKVVEELTKDKYQEAKNDPYFLSPQFTKIIADWDAGEVTYQKAIDETFDEVKNRIVGTYPLTNFAYNSMDSTLKNQTPLNMKNFRTLITLKAAEETCVSSIPDTNADYITLGKKYFCPS